MFLNMAPSATAPFQVVVSALQHLPDSIPTTSGVVPDNASATWNHGFCLGMSLAQADLARVIPTKVCSSSLSYQHFFKKETTLSASHVSLLTHSYIPVLYIHTDTKITAVVSTSIFQTSKTYLQLVQHRYAHCNSLSNTLWEQRSQPWRCSTATQLPRPLV